MKDIVTHDRLIKKMFRRKQLTRSTQEQIISNITEYCTLFNMNPSELRKEAYDEQLTIIDPLERQIDTKLDTYYEYLETQDLKNSTINNKLSIIRSFYKEYKVVLPDNVELSIDFEKPEKDLITLEHIRQVVNNTSNIIFKAIITLMASSGIRQVDIGNLTINDFLIATMDYHNGIEQPIETILNQLSEQEAIIPIWEFTPQKTKKKKTKAITCNSPECTDYILTYLKTRKNLQLNDYLFLNYHGNKYNSSNLGKVFARLNERNGFGLNSKGETFFHGSGLRDFFATTLNRNKVSFPIFKKMMGHSMGMVNNTYIHIDKDTVFDEYKNFVDKLSISEVHVHDFKSKEYIKLEQDNEDKEKRLTNLEKEIEEIKAANEGKYLVNPK